MSCWQTWHQRQKTNLRLITTFRESCQAQGQKLLCNWPSGFAPECPCQCNLPHYWINQLKPLCCLHPTWMHPVSVRCVDQLVIGHKTVGEFKKVRRSVDFSKEHGTKIGPNKQQRPSFTLQHKCSICTSSPTLVDKDDKISEYLPLSELSLKERKPALLSQGTLEGPVFLLSAENHWVIQDVLSLGLQIKHCQNTVNYLGWN